ncbi:MAG: sulfite exporter TauE/SafE family protein [Gemmatimonadota bacterium]
MLLIIGAVAFGVSLLTLFSGFGLGTLLLPVFALFFPVETAVAATALVHGANSFFKVGLLRREIDRSVLVRFGFPAIGSALVGAWVLTRLSNRGALHTWGLGGREMTITPVGVVMGALILGFSAFELVPRLRDLRAPPRALPLGGVLSGFFGGLSGHQGALRAAFLTPLGLSPAAFAATQASLAALVDVARLSVYVSGFLAGTLAGPASREQWTAVAVGTLCAFAGALVGRRLLGKATIRGIRTLTGLLLLLVGAGLLSGLL